MRNSISEFIVSFATVFIALFAIGYHFWVHFSVKCLKRWLNVETSAYLKWHDRRARLLQAQLDNEHSHYPSF